jgi:hypothetical protein
MKDIKQINAILRNQKNKFKYNFIYLSMVMFFILICYFFMNFLTFVVISIITLSMACNKIILYFKEYTTTNLIDNSKDNSVQLNNYLMIVIFVGFIINITSININIKSYLLACCMFIILGISSFIILNFLYFLYEIKKHKIVEEINIYNDINIESRLDLDNEKYSIDHVLEEKITIIRTEGLFYDDLYIKNKTYKLKE